jgi:hypothetical protein
METSSFLRKLAPSIVSPLLVMVYPFFVRSDARTYVIKKQLTTTASPIRFIWYFLGECKSNGMNALKL